MVKPFYLLIAYFALNSNVLTLTCLQDIKQTVKVKFTILITL